MMLKREHAAVGNVLRELCLMCLETLMRFGRQNVEKEANLAAAEHAYQYSQLPM